MLVSSIFITSCKISSKNKLHDLASEFFEAISLNDMYNAKQFIKLNDINMKDKFGVTLLMKACGALNYSGVNEDLYDYDAAMLLINSGADVKLKDNKGYSALDYAVMYAQTEFCSNNLIDVLIEKNAPFNVDKAENILSGYENTFKDYNVVKKIAKRFDISKSVSQQEWKAITNDALNYDECIKLSDKNKIKILFNLIAYSDEIQLQNYINAVDVSINSTDEYGNSPLHVSAMTGNVKTFNYLSDKYGVNSKGGYPQYTAFQYAALNQHMDICKIWIEKNMPLSSNDIESLYSCTDKSLMETAFKSVNPNNVTLNKMLVNANKYATVEYLDTILSFEIDIDSVFDDSTLLERASYLGNENLVKYALNKGANPNGIVLKYSPIFYAVSNNNIEIVKLLIEKGADVTKYVKCDDGSKESLPLEIAKINKNESIVRILEAALGKK